MGSREASLHLRCEDRGTLLPKLKTLLDDPSFWREETEDLLGLLGQVFEQQLPQLDERKQRAGKALLDNLRTGLDDWEQREDPAIVVVRPHFVSLYWYDHIRSENLEEQAWNFGRRCRVPVLGVCRFDICDLQLCGVRNAGCPEAVTCRGDYYFNEHDIQPVDAGELCRILEAPFLQEGVAAALACSDGEGMAQMLEKALKMPIYLNERMLSAEGKRPTECWRKTLVYVET